METGQRDGHSPISKKSVVDVIIDTLVTDIADGRYPPGAKLPNEYELISEFDVSRNSLREAIKIMSAMGIVEIRRGDGTYVCEQTAPSALDKVVYSLLSCMSSDEELIELRIILDESTLRMAIEKSTPEEVANLEANIREMRRAIDGQDMERAEELDYQFHTDMIASCKNVLFTRMVSGVYTIFRNSIGRTIHQDSVFSKAPEVHQEMLDCIRNKDYGSVHNVIVRSLESWRDKL